MSLQDRTFSFCREMWSSYLPVSIAVNCVLRLNYSRKVPAACERLNLSDPAIFSWGLFLDPRAGSRSDMLLPIFPLRSLTLVQYTDHNGSQDSGCESLSGFNSLEVLYYTYFFRSSLVFSSTSRMLSPSSLILKRITYRLFVNSSEASR